MSRQLLFVICGSGLTLFCACKVVDVAHEPVSSDTGLVDLVAYLGEWRVTAGAVVPESAGEGVGMATLAAYDQSCSALLLSTINDGEVTETSLVKLARFPNAQGGMIVASVYTHGPSAFGDDPQLLYVLRLQITGERIGVHRLDYDKVTAAVAASELEGEAFAISEDEASIKITSSGESFGAYIEANPDVFEAETFYELVRPDAE